MFEALGQIFRAIFKLGVAAESAANALVSVTAVAEQTAETFRKEEEIKGRKRLEDLEAD